MYEMDDKAWWAAWAAQWQAHLQLPSKHLTQCLRNRVQADSAPTGVIAPP